MTGGGALSVGRLSAHKQRCLVPARVLSFLLVRCSVRTFPTGTASEGIGLRLIGAPSQRRIPLLFDMQDYRKIRAHRKAHAVMLAVKRATLRFPRRGYASFATQLTDAAESVPFNIVEGCGASSQKEFARFLEISIKSSMELEYQLKVAMDYEVLDAIEGHSLSVETIDVRRMLCGLRAKVLAAPDVPPPRPNGTTEKRETQDASRAKRRRKAPRSN